MTIPLPPPFVSLMMLCAVAALAVYLALKSRSGGLSARAASFFIFWFFIILSPTSSIVPILDVIYEHRLYLASMGFFAAVVIGIDSAISAAVRAKQA